jgi:hypothetical protein
MERQAVMLYMATVYLNRTARFMPWTPGDFLSIVNEHALTFDTDSPEMAAEHTFTVGNKMSRDTFGNVWPGNIRSVSVGDAVCVFAVDDAGKPQGDAFFYSCERAGWRMLGDVEVANITVRSRNCDLEALAGYGLAAIDD